MALTSPWIAAGLGLILTPAICLPQEPPGKPTVDPQKRRQVKVGLLQPRLPEKEDTWSRHYDPARVRPKVQRNIDHICALLEEAGQQGCDIVCTPEDMCGILSYGLRPHESLPGETKPIIQALIPDLLNETTHRIAAIAKKYRMYVIACLLVRDQDGKAYNVALLFDRSGKLVGMYRKVHLPSFEPWHTAHGQAFPVFATDFGTVGIMICYDMDFPEAARILALSGADIIFHPTVAQYFDGKPERLQTAIKARTRAMENHVYICPAIYGNRGSGIIDPKGKVVAEQYDKTDVVVTGVLDLAQEVRDESKWWTAVYGTDLIRARYLLQRRPGTYELLPNSRPPLQERYRDVKLVTGDDHAAIRRAIEQINYSPAARRQKHK